MSNGKLKTLVMGDYTNPPHHPLGQVEKVFTEILSENCQLTFSEDRSLLERESLNSFDLLVSYLDTWEQPMDLKYLGNLLSFVAQGGGFLVLHNGMSYQYHPEFAQLVGAKFNGHPRRRDLTFKLRQEGHPITQGIDDFIINEEPYRFIICNFSKSTIFMEYEFEGSLMPAGWCHTYGLGRVVYLMPGHNQDSFSIPEYQKLIARGALWAGKRI